MYLPFGRNYRAGMTVHVKLAGGGRPAEVAALRAVREELRAIDERLPVLMLKTLEEFRESTIYLYQASPYDPVVFSVAPMVLAAASMLASYLPARRAMRVEPIIALRTE